MPFRKPRRMLRGKSYEKHSDTLISVIGPGTAVIPSMLIRQTQAGDRDPAGAEGSIQQGRDNAEECEQGDLCKFLNITIQAGPRTASDANMGWLEWAMCIMKGSDPEPTKANLGVSTLGDIMTKYLRNMCIYTGVLPVGRAQSTVQTISLKMPKAKWRLEQGDVWRFFFMPRTVSSTETSTDMFKVLTSYNYKNYH